MRYLHEFIEASFESQRIERKYILNPLQAQGAYSVLRHANFKIQYQKRKIFSLYFDTNNFGALRDNIDGNPNRNKFRLRYYNSDLNKCFIEIKQKRASIGYKHKILIPEKFRSLKDLKEFGFKWQKDNIIESLNPTAFVCYDRLYFINNTFRATLDLNVSGYKIIGRSFVSSKFPKYSVVEFKYHLGDDDKFRAYHSQFARFALRNTKSSKYANALMW